MSLRRPAALVVALAVGLGLLAVPARPAGAWPTVERIAGADRYDTAARVALSRFTGSGLARVYVATGESYADALAASGAAGLDGAPVLLVQRDKVPGPTTGALDRFAPKEIVLLGGPGVIAAAVEDAMRTRWGAVRRVEGRDRYETAANLYAGHGGGRPTVFIANGQGFADALSAGAKAAKDKMPLLLVQPDAVPAATAAALRALSPVNIVVVGGPAAVSEQVYAQLAGFKSGTIQRWSGRDRYETAVSVAHHGFGSAAGAYLSTGSNFPDALAAGPVAGMAGAPVVLTTQPCMSPPTKYWLVAAGVQRLAVLGGEGVVSDAAAGGDTNCPVTAAPPAPRYSGSSPILAAFYYGWYPSSFEMPGSKHMPSAGHYDSQDLGTVRRQIAEMRSGGIRAGIASWWGRESLGPEQDYAAWVTDRSFRVALQAAEHTPFTWAMYYEDEGYSNPSVAQLQADLDYIWSTYVNHPNFLWMDGKPVLFVWPGPTDTCEMVSRWQQANAGRFYVVHKRFVGWNNCVGGASSWHEYSPNHSGIGVAPWSYAVSPGFWRYDQTSPVLTRDPAAFDRAVATMRASGAHWQLVTTYNEWGEGTAVEPSTEWGTTYLDILRKHYGTF